MKLLLVLIVLASACSNQNALRKERALKVQQADLQALLSARDLVETENSDESATQFVNKLGNYREMHSDQYPEALQSVSPTLLKVNQSTYSTCSAKMGAVNLFLQDNQNGLAFEGLKTTSKECRNPHQLIQLVRKYQTRDKCTEIINMARELWGDAFRAQEKAKQIAIMDTIRECSTDSTVAANFSGISPASILMYDLELSKRDYSNKVNKIQGTYCSQICAHRFKLAPNGRVCEMPEGVMKEAECKAAEQKCVSACSN